MRTKSFSPEYLAHVNMANPKWRVIRWLAMAPTLHRDAVCPVLKATQLDHLTYARLGRELPLIDVVPLNKWTHKLVGALRDMGLRGPVNLALRMAYASWFVAWLYAAAMIGQMAGVVHGVPWPNAIGSTIARDTKIATLRVKNIQRRFSGDFVRP